MINELLISVIVPIYNVEKYLDRCIKSIISQTYQNLEIILVDDGSTDKSGDICDKYRRLDKRIKVYHKKNGGLSSARNYGLNKSKADIVGFVDSDDFINETMYEKLLKNMIETDSDISIGRVWSFKNNDDLINVKKESVLINTYEKDAKFKRFLEEKNFNWILVSNKLYRKKVLWQNCFPIGKIHEDAFIMHYVFERANRIVYSSEYLFYYFIRNDSISHSYNLNRLDEIEAVKDRLNFFTQKRFKNTNYYDLALKSYVGYLIEHYWFLNYYNKKNSYTKYIHIIKKEFDNNYKKIIVSKSINFYDRIKYFIVYYFPYLYLILKYIDVKLLRRSK